MHMVEACCCWCGVPVLGAGAGAGAVSCARGGAAGHPRAQSSGILLAHAGTSVSEAAACRCSLLQAAVWRPSLSKRRLLSLHCQKRAPAPSTGTPTHGTQHHHPALSGGPPPRAQPAHSTSAQHPAPCLHHVHSQRTAPAPAPGTEFPNSQTFVTFQYTFFYKIGIHMFLICTCSKACTPYKIINSHPCVNYPGVLLQCL